MEGKIAANNVDQRMEKRKKYMHVRSKSQRAARAREQFSSNRKC